MALVGNISGSNGQSKNAVTGSLVIADVNINYPTIASDAVLFVSGNIDGGSKAVIGGDLVVSGTTKTLSDLTFSGSNFYIGGNVSFQNDILFLDKANSRVGIGTSTPEATLSITSQGTSNTRGVSGFHFDNSTAFSQFKFIGGRARGSVGSPSAVQANDSLASFNGRGYKTTGWSNTVGGLYIYAKEAWTDSSTPTYITFRGVAAGAGTTVSEWAKLESTGLTVTQDITGSNALFTGDIAVNGGDITTTGAVLNISAGANGLAFLNGTSPFVLAQSSSYNSMPGVVASANVGKIFAAAGKDLLIGPANAKSVFITGSSVVVNADTNGFQVQKDGTELLRIISGSGNNFLNINSGPNMLTANMFTSNIVNMSFGSATSTASFGGDLGINGRTGLAGVTERMSHFQGGNTFICNMINQSIFYVSSPSGGVTANFTNVPTTTNRIHTPTVILSQSGTPQIVSTVQIDGGPTTILWPNGVTPTGTANKIEAFGFSLIRSGSVWTVLGQMSSYG